MGDRTTRPPGEAADFTKKFGMFLKELNPDYEINSRARGIRHEFLRELAPGVFASHNVLCKRGVYHHGVCVSLHRELSDPYLLSPLVIGGRFNHNYSSKSAYFRDVRPNRRWPFGKENFSDSHLYRKGWESIVEKCTRIAEEKILPHYFSRVTTYKESLLHLLENLLTLDKIPTEIDRGESHPSCVLFPIQSDYDMQTFAEAYKAAKGRRDEFTLEVICRKPELFNMIREMPSLPDLLKFLRS